VPCPHKGTSVVGVNQRSLKRLRAQAAYRVIYVARGPRAHQGPGPERSADALLQPGTALGSAPGGTASTKAVSLRHISAAMDCRVLSSKLAKASSRHTAAGLPWKARLANASTCGNANEFTKD